MNVTFKDGVLSVNLDAALERMTDSEKLDMAERLSCENAIIKHVADQILEGYTEYGSHGAISIDAEPDPHLPLDAARRRVAKDTSALAHAEIARLERALARSQERVRELQAEINHRDYPAFMRGY